jgi:hypothetical protein
MKTDQIRMDIIDITFVFIFLSRFGLSTILDRIRLNINIVNMGFEYSDTNTVSDVEYPDSNTDRFEPL